MMPETKSLSSMDETLLSVIACPTCGRGLERQGEERPLDESRLECAAGHVYPFVGGVLEALDDVGTTAGGRVDAAGGAESGPPTRPSEDSDDYANIRRSFSQEWQIFDYNADKTWGWTIDDRLRVFVGDVGVPQAALSGKRLLDAGCGNGTLTAALAGFGMRIIGLDLNDHLAAAHRNRGRLSPKAVENVRYVHGNLVKPPFRENSFDLVYSSGVIHHTPDSRASFDSLVRVTKPGGRLYVWVYSRRALPVRVFFGVGRRLKDFVSLRSVMWFCRTIAPIYRLGTIALDKLGFMTFRARSSREITLDLFDAFAPRFNHQHSESEVRSWFESHGFRNVTTSGHQKHGFGMYGDRP
jgi:ubiquinone/menaquinone biosynthesis C-methylase UbiE